MSKFRYQDTRKIKIGGKNCYSTKVFELKNNSYFFIGEFHIPVSLPKKNWDEFVKEEQYIADIYRD